MWVEAGPRRQTMGGFSTGATSEAGKAVALAVVLSAVTAYIPFLGIFLMPVLPLPTAYVTFRRGLGVGLATAFGAGVLSAALTGLGNGVLTLLVTGIVGSLLGVALARKWGFTTTLLAVTVGGAVTFGTSTAVAWFIAGLGFDQFGKLLDESMVAASQMYISMGMDPAVVEEASVQLREWFSMLPYLLPSILGVAGLMLASAALALVAVVFPHLGEKGAGDLAFSRFRLHWSASYGFIFGLALLIFAGRFGGAAESARLVGLNLFLFFQTLFFIQGLALIHWFMTSRGYGTGTRVAMYTAALVGQLMLQFTSWAGLLDTWFDYRKRFAVATPPAGSVGPRGREGAGDQEEM